VSGTKEVKMRPAFIAAVLGGLAMFLLDPDAGRRRRRDLVRVLGEAQQPLQQAGKSSRRAARDARKASRQAAKTVGEWRRDASGRAAGPPATAWILVLAGIATAAAAGVAAAYAFDPQRGARRRRRLGQAAQHARDQVRQQGAGAAELAKERVSEIREEIPKPGDQ
jgi:gas vesicle protein